MTPAISQTNPLLNVINSYRFRRGVALLKNSKTAIRGLRALGKAARSGNLEAQYALGLCYLRGDNVPANHASAIRWLLPAAAAGHTAAQCRLASLCLQGSATVRYDTFSTTSIFSDLFKGGKSNFVDASYWASEAAARGSPEGLAILGFIQSEGPEAFRDLAAARRSYEASAKAGFPKGSLGLAVLTLREGMLTQERRDLAKELLRKAEDGNEPLASYYLGGIAETENDVALALSKYRHAAQRNIPEAQLRLGILLSNDAKPYCNTHEAEGWLRRAGNAGNTTAAAMVGDSYARHGDLPPNYQEALIWYQKAAVGGNEAAARKLARLFLGGLAGAQDKAGAIEWLTHAVSLGSLHAVAELGELLRASSSIIPRLRDAALEALAVRAESGDEQSALELTFCLDSNRIDANSEKYFKYVRQAAERFPLARLKYGQFLLRQEPSRVGEAREQFVVASEAGVVEAQVLAAEMVLNGRGGEANPSQALRLFSQAAESGHIGAMFALAFLLEGKYGLPKMPDISRTWLERAAQGGHPAAQFALGCSLARQATQEGRDPAMVEEASEWLRRAQASGVRRAAAELGRLGTIHPLAQSA